MIDDLLEVMNKKFFAEVILADEGSVQGFVTLVEADRFHIVTLEPVAPLLTPENHIIDEFGNMYVEQNPEDVNLLPVKHSYDPMIVSGIVFDVTHRLQPEFNKSIKFLRDNVIFVQEEPKADKVTKKKPGNKQKSKPKAPIIKE